MPRLKMDGREMQVAGGATLLEAARAAGIEIPTLCYLKETGPLTSCMLCVVKDLATGRLVPSCAVAAEDGMEICTTDDDVMAARRETLTMLLNEHVGDCEGPCSRMCPAGLDIPRMLRYIAAGDADAAARLAKRDLVFPATLGCVCSAPCERVCRRKQYDKTIEIRHAHRFLGETPGDFPIAAGQTGQSVAVVGAGLAGLAAAWTLVMRGHACRVYEKRDIACAALRGLPAEKLPPEILDAEIAAVQRIGVETHFGEAVDTLNALLEVHDAVIVACGLEHAEDGRVFDAPEDVMAVRAVGHGKKAAFAADAFLRGVPPPPAKMFNSTLGPRLEPAELPAYAVERLQPSPPGSTDALIREAARCLHCDCHKIVTCKLRQYAEEYGLAPQIRRTMPRMSLLPIERYGEVIFETGKCIRCGICVEMTRAAGLPLGMTMTGRGLGSYPRPAFGGPLAAGLGPLAEACARACPTAALAIRTHEERE